MLVKLDDRALIEITGPDWRALLQGLITNDVEQITNDKLLYAGLLTPQGKYLYDFFLHLKDADTLWLDCAADHKDALVRKLMMYRLRSKVDFKTLETAVFAAFGSEDLPGLTDPRLAAMGTRIYTDMEADGDMAAYTTYRHSLGIPDGPQDYLQDKTLWLEGNTDLLNGVDFKKGCYVGQELTARMRYRGKVRRRLIPVTAETDLNSGTTITLGERDMGDIRSVSGTHALANLRTEDLEKGPLMADGVEITPWVPDWMLPALEKTADAS